MIRRGQFFLNFRLAIFIKIDICLEQVTDFQHGSPVKGVAVPMAYLSESLIQLVEKRGVVYQVLFENGKLFFHDHIQTAGSEESFRNLRQANHLVHKREFTDVLANVALDRKTVASCLFLRGCRFFAIIGPNDNVVVVFYAQNILLAPSFQLDYEDAFSGHKNTNIKLSSENLTVPIDDVCIIQIFLNFVDEQLLAKVFSIARAN